MNFGQFSQANGATGAQAAAINAARARAYQGIQDFMADNVLNLNINPNNVGRVQQDINQLERISAWGQDQLGWYNWLSLFIEKWTASGVAPLDNLLMDNAKHAIKFIQDIVGANAQMQHYLNAGVQTRKSKRFICKRSS